MAQALDQALLALRAGQPAQAQAFIAQVLRTDPRNIDAWLLLEQCVDVVDRKKYCLQQVLLISPDNQSARQRLAVLTAPPSAIAQQPAPPAGVEPAPIMPPQTPPEPAPEIVAEPQTSEPEVSIVESESAAPPSTEPATADHAFQKEAAEPDYDLLRSASAPPPTAMESALMDEESFQPGPFAMDGASAGVDAYDDNGMASIPETPAFATIAPDSLAAPDQAVSETSTAVTLPGIARNIDKNAIRSRLEQAVSNIEGGRKAEGVAQLEEIVTLDPRNEMAWMWLGAAAEDDVRKRECYRQALAVNPRSKMARDYLRAVETRLGSVPDSEANVEGATSGGPSLIVWAVIAVVVVVIAIVVFLLLRRMYLG